MGWVVKPLRTNRSYSTKFGSNTASYQTIHRRQSRDPTFPHSRTTKIEGGMRRIRSRRLGCPVCQSDLLIHADTLMGSRHMYLRRSSGPKNCYLASHHRVEQETRTHHPRQRPKYGIPNWHPTEVRKLQPVTSRQGKMLVKRGWPRRPIPMETRHTNLQHSQLCLRYTDSVDIWIQRQTGSLVCRFSCNYTCQPQPRRLLFLPKVQ